MAKGQDGDEHQRRWQRVADGLRRREEKQARRLTSVRANSANSVYLVQPSPSTMRSHAGRRLPFLRSPLFRTRQCTTMSYLLWGATRACTCRSRMRDGCAVPFGASALPESSTASSHASPLFYGLPIFPQRETEKIKHCRSKDQEPLAVCFPHARTLITPLPIGWSPVDIDEHPRTWKTDAGCFHESGAIKLGWGCMQASRT
ncbi:hypothetical protein LXA43DRAFT_725542 [Ganoderma leucocontextum]|nr:hypothetical protein LXA43DRAFT_725542 [Ganoderma leucocontextum]